MVIKSMSLNRFGINYYYRYLISFSGKETPWVILCSLIGKHRIPDCSFVLLAARPLILSGNKIVIFILSTSIIIWIISIQIIHIKGKRPFYNYFLLFAYIVVQFTLARNAKILFCLIKKMMSLFYSII